MYLSNHPLMIFPSEVGKLTEKYNLEKLPEKSELFVPYPESEDDLISSLPDNVLCHILSFLPTKYAVGTAILSSKWKDLFPLVPNLSLEFDDSLLLHPNPLEEEEEEKDFAAEIEPKEVRESSFIDFVGGVLKRLLQSKASVHEFKLKCQNIYNDDCLASWLRDAVSLGVQSVCLNASMRDSGKVIGAFDGYTGLVELYLVKCSVRNVLSYIMFPSLKTLVLDQVELSDGESSAFLLDGCSVIDTLVLNRCEINMDCFCIGLPWLKNLIIRCCYITSNTEMWIDVDELESLYYVGMLAESFEFHFVSIDALAVHIIPMNKLLQGEDEELDDSCYNFVKLAGVINPCSEVESLTLGEFTIEALYHLSLPLPKFSYLESLQLGTIGMAGWNTLGGLLENAPNLQKLSIEGFNIYEGGFASFLSSLNGVPPCLSSSLKEIKITSLNGQEDEILLMEYFLENGKVMEKLFINGDVEGEEKFINSVIKRMLAASFRSKTCEIFWS